MPLNSHPDLRVGDCVPLYFCPRSVMLYVIHKANHPELAYRGGQDPIVHQEADLHETAAWADRNGRRWTFTLSNAGSSYFRDRCDLAQLDEIDWEAVHATVWHDRKKGKQAAFLVEHAFPWASVQCVSVRSGYIRGQARRAVGEVLRTSRRNPGAFRTCGRSGRGV